MRLDFSLIGMPKAGTTVLWHWLRQHNEVFLPDLKEPGYFAFAEGQLMPSQGPLDRHYWSKVVTDQAAYEELFQEANGRLCGDASPIYALCPEALAAIARLNPAAKIVLVLRDPAQRAFSQYAHHRRDGLEPCKTLQEALRQELDGMRANWSPFHRYLESSRIRPVVERAQASFPREQILILQYEDLCQAPEATVAKICRFLGIRDDLEIDVAAKHNVSQGKNHARSEGLRRLLNQGSRVTKLASRGVPKPVRQTLKKRLVDWNNGAPLTPGPGEMAMVERLLAAEYSWLTYARTTQQ